LKAIKKLAEQFFSFSKGKVVRNLALVAVTTLLVKGIGFFKELVIASNLGLSELLDTYLIALLIPGFISTVFLGSYKSVFIPNYIFARNNGENSAQFLGSSLLVTLVIGLFFMLIAYLFGDLYLEFFFQGHSPEYYELIKKQLYLLLPCIIFWSMSSLFSGLLNIDKEFFWSSLTGIFIPLVIIILLLFFKSELQEYVLAAGTLIGAIINTFYLIFICHKRGILSVKKPNLKSQGVLQMIKQLPAKISSALINGLNEPVDQFFSAQLAVGSISALNYGIKLPAFAIGIVGIAIGNVILPYFSEIAALSLKAVYQRLEKILLIAFISCGCISALFFLLSEPMIAFVFQRDEFTTTDTNLVYPIQQMYALQIPFYIMGIVLNRFLTSINKNNFLVISSILSLLLNIVLNFWLIDTLGIKGLALATSIVSLINTVVIYIYIKSIKKNINV